MKQIVDKLNKIAKKIDESVEIPQTDLIIDSLDAITKAYGGTPNDSNLIVDKLEDIYNNIEPAVSGNIEITENGENINVAPYATATVNVSGGGGDTFPHCKAHAVNNTESELTISGVLYDTGVYEFEITLQANESVDMVAFYKEQDNEVLLVPDPLAVPMPTPDGWFSDLSNLELEGEDTIVAKVIDTTATSSCTVDARFFELQQ